MVVAAEVDVFLVGAVVVADLVGLDLDHAGGQLVNKPAVVRDDDQRAGEALEPLDQRLDRLEVEVIGRLVEDQHVGFDNTQAAKYQSGGLAARQRAESLVDIVAGKEHQCQLAAHEADRLVLAALPDPGLGGVGRRVEIVAMVLGEVAGMGLVAPFDRTGVGRQFAHGDLEQCRLADAIGAHDRQAVAFLHQQVDPVQHFVIPEGLFDAGDLEHVASAVALLVEAKIGVAARAVRQLDHRLLRLLNQFQLGLGLAGLGGFGAEAIDKLLVVCDLALARGDLFFAARALLALGLLKEGVIATVEDDGLVVDVEDGGADIVEKAVVVRDDDGRPGIVAQEHFEPADREDVEVVGRLVEEQHVGVAGQDLGQQDPELETARQCRQRVVVDLGRQAEALENGAGAGFGTVAVEA